MEFDQAVEKRVSASSGTKGRIMNLPRSPRPSLCSA